MKMRYVLLFFCLSLSFAIGHAANPVNTEDFSRGILQIEDSMINDAAIYSDKQLLKAEKQQYRAEKRMAWFSKVINKKMAGSKSKAIGGFDDPVDKWFWYWVIAWGGAIVFSFIFWPITLLLMIGGTISLILWIVKKFA